MNTPGDGDGRAGPPALTDYDEEDTDDQQAAGDIPDPAFGTVQDWVTSYFLPVFRRSWGGEFRWCPRWWDHAEAVSRLTALWRAWETFRLEPATGIADWYREHLDHQLPILLGARGPFYQCSDDEHRQPRQGQAADPPPGWWDLLPEDDRGFDPGPALESAWPGATWEPGGAGEPSGADRDSNTKDRPTSHTQPPTADGDPDWPRGTSR